MRQFRNFFGKYWFLAAAFLMVTVFMTIVTGKKDLTVYTGGDSQIVVQKETEAPKPFRSFSYVNNDSGLSMQVPEGWTYVKKDGFDTFVHSASASSLQIQSLSYYPMVNNVTQESLAETYANMGYVLTEFGRSSETEYYIIYKKNGIDGVTDYIEYVLWDRSHVMKVLMIFQENFYDKLSDDIWACLDSITWARPDPVSEGTYLLYFSYGDFEVAVPTGWITAIADNTFYATDEESGAFMTVDCVEDSTWMKDFSQVDYTSYLSGTRNSFVLSVFNQSDDAVYSEATYMNGNVSMGLIQYYYVNGTYHYIITYEFPLDYGDYYAPLARDAVDMTRVFFVSDVPVLQETESETKPSFYDTFLEKAEENSNREVLENTGSLLKKDETEELYTFADAIVEVAGVSLEKAEDIESAWIESVGTNPVFLDLAEVSDESVVLLLTDDQDVKYYIFLDPESGELQDIRYAD